MRVLLEHGADICAVDAQGLTPVRASFLAKDFEKCSLLLARAPNRNLTGRSVLMDVVDSEETEMVKFCLERGYNVLDKDQVRSKMEDQAHLVL